MRKQGWDSAKFCAWAGIFSVGKSNRNSQTGRGRTPCTPTASHSDRNGRKSCGFFQAMVVHIAHERNADGSQTVAWPQQNSWVLVIFYVSFTPSVTVQSSCLKLQSTLRDHVPSSFSPALTHWPPTSLLRMVEWVPLAFLHHLQLMFLQKVSLHSAPEVLIIKDHFFLLIKWLHKAKVMAF